MLKVKFSLIKWLLDFSVALLGPGNTRTCDREGTESTDSYCTFKFIAGYIQVELKFDTLSAHLPHKRKRNSIAKVGS